MEKLSNLQKMDTILRGVDLDGVRNQPVLMLAFLLDVFEKGVAYGKALGATEDDGIVFGLTKVERDFVHANNKIGAIKAHRERTNIGLKESKDAIDYYCVKTGRAT